MTDLLPEGSIAPQFTALSTSGDNVSLADLKGKKVVLYFYPKDDTPGCTKEACAFRDKTKELTDKGAIVLGVSRDKITSHNKFKAKYHLSFDLLSDEDGQISDAYHAWGEKSMYGRKYMGMFRVTYVIDEQGKIMKVFPKVDPVKHADQILELL
jgi:peroxiredoxin Q/BCP